MHFLLYARFSIIVFDLMQYPLLYLQVSILVHSLIFYSIGMIKRSVKPFKVRDFAKEAEKTFIHVNTCLTKYVQSIQYVDF